MKKYEHNSMTQVDVIIPSNGINQKLIKMTQDCIDSLIRSETKNRFNILVFEQQPNVVYDNAGTIHYSYSFNYNKIMNDGISRTNSPYLCMANNDLLFSVGWCTALLKYSNEFLSMSPRCPSSQVSMTKYVIYEGYGIGKEISGWCIFCDRKIFDIIGKLDESPIFWWSDNAYADALKRHNIKHALISNSIVQHLMGKTTANIGFHKVLEYVNEQKNG